MLNKNKIISELKNKEFIVRNAIYEHICNLHLYDDEDINKAFIAFLQDNYNLEINYVGLIHSKLNKDIIECLIQIYFNEEDKDIKEEIEYVLVNHYELIKDLNYKFEEIFQNEYSLTLYKKIKHFANKKPEELLELYIRNIEQYYLEGEETYTSDILKSGMETALIQTDEGQILFILYVLSLMGALDIKAFENIEKDEYIEEFKEVHLPYLIHPLCKIADSSYASAILMYYFTDLDFLEHADECNYYFSNIGDKEFVTNYIEILKKFEKRNLPDYFYDIAEFLNSEEIDKFLLEKINTSKDKEIILNIIRILAGKFDNRIIEIALDKVKDDDFYAKDEILILELAPLLIIEKRSDKISKMIIKEADSVFHTGGIWDFEDDYEENEDDYDYEDKIYQLEKSIRDCLLKDKPHIKEYKKARKIHGEIIDSMMRYFENSKYQENMKKIYMEMINQNNNNIQQLDTFFDTRTQLGAQAFADVIIYKNIENMNCITEEFLKTNRYKKKEKEEFLKSMLDSKLGLYEIIKTDFDEAQVYAKNVFNGEIIKLTDIGMSRNKDNIGYYFYMRIISYNGINFGTGLTFIFDKDDKFIQKWIEDNKADYNKKAEILRFLELYSKYRDDENKIVAHMNRF